MVKPRDDDAGQLLSPATGRQGGTNQSAALRQEHRDLVRKVVRQELRPEAAEADVEDVTHDVLVALEGYGLAKIANLKAFVRRAVRHAVIDRVRKEKKHRSVADPATLLDPGRHQRRFEIREDAARRLALLELTGEQIGRVQQMSWRQALLFVLAHVDLCAEEDLRAFRHYLVCEDVQQVAVAENRSKRTIQLRLRRVRTALEDLIDWLDSDPDPDGGTSGGSTQGGPGGGVGPGPGSRASKRRGRTGETRQKLKAAAGLLLAMLRSHDGSIEEEQQCADAGRVDPDEQAVGSPEELRESAQLLCAALGEASYVGAFEDREVPLVARREPSEEARNPYRGMTREDFARLAWAVAGGAKASLADPDLDAAIKVAWLTCWDHAEGGAEIAEPAASLRAAAARCFSMMKKGRSQLQGEQPAEKTAGIVHAEHVELPHLSNDVAREIDEAVDVITAKRATEELAATSVDFLPQGLRDSGDRTRVGGVDAGGVTARDLRMGGLPPDLHGPGPETGFGKTTRTHRRTWLWAAAALFVLGVLAGSLVRLGAEPAPSREAELLRFVAEEVSRLMGLAGPGPSPELWRHHIEAKHESLVGVSVESEQESAPAERVEPGQEILPALTCQSEEGCYAEGEQGIFGLALFDNRGRFDAVRRVRLGRWVLIDIGTVYVFNRERLSADMGEILLIGVAEGAVRVCRADMREGGCAKDIEGGHLVYVMEGQDGEPQLVDMGKIGTAADAQSVVRMPPAERTRLAEGVRHVRNELALTTPKILKLESAFVGCRNSQGCRNGGRCTAIDGKCKATSDEDCRWSVACKNGGRCTAIDGKCKATSDEDCRKSHWCKRRGECAAVDGQCRRGCRKTDACKQRGRCESVDGVCRATSDEDCKKSDWCKQRGRCESVGGVCKATSDEDCQNSYWCKKSGYCWAVDGACTMVCKGKKWCTQHGRCKAVDGACVATSNAACRKSEVCKHYGHCTVVDGVCRARSDKDCKQSWGCGTLGQCTHVGGKCLATSNDDCKKSKWCKAHGRCVADGGVCKAATASGP